MIRHLDDWRLPQPHDTCASGRRREADPGCSTFLDRERYVAPDGRLFGDAELGDAHAGNTIQSDALPLEPGNLRDMDRAPIATPTAARFTSGGPEEYSGPSVPVRAWQRVRRAAGARRRHGGPRHRPVETCCRTRAPIPLFPRRCCQAKARPDRIWHGVIPGDDEAALGTTFPARSARWGIRRSARDRPGRAQYEVAGKLGKAFLSSFNDTATLLLTLHYNRSPFFDGITNFVRAFGSESADYANQGGLIAESVIADMNRWGENNVGRGWSARLANATMKASLLTA